MDQRQGGGPVSYQQWAARHPKASAELQLLLHAVAHFQPEGAQHNSEAYAQQQVRMQIAKQGGMTWRNNVGAYKTKEQHRCPRCQFCFKVEQAPIRWGLCNDSAKLNTKIKSSDLIGIVPRFITPEMAGTTIGQFLAVETKKPGWKFSGNKHETAQLLWLELIAGKGGLSMFSTGAVQL
jgi:hypothetical protein